MGLGLVYFIFGLLVLVLAFLAVVVGFGGLVEEEKMSSFECGFMRFQGARLSFSLQFFLVAIVFLIFDVEIALILPLPVVMLNTGGLFVILIVLVFVLVVLGGLYYEWGSGVLDWAY